MAFEKGSLVLVEYTAKLEDGTVIEAANQGDAPDGERNFSPRPKLVSVGDPSYPVLRGFDRALADAEVSAPQTVTIQPADAYGERRRDKVKMITARKLGKDADRYTVGDTVEVNGSTGVILSMGSGRVRVDFNHMFAGKTITYEFTVLKQLESDTDKIEGLLAQAGMLRDYPLPKPGKDLDDDLPELDDLGGPGDGGGSTDEDLDAALKDDLDEDLDDDLDDEDDLGAPEGSGSADEDSDDDDDLDDDLDELDDLSDDDLDDEDDPDEEATASTTSGYALKGDTLTVDVPASLHRDPKIQGIKHLVQMDLFRFVPSLREVRFLEVHRNAAMPRT